MELIILIAGFIGAWLLVAGSVYQAALELQEQRIDGERLRDLGSKMARPPRVSAWWWLLPPIMIILVKRQREKYQKAYYDLLTVEESELILSYFHKSTAWLYVSFGGFLLAAKETYELDGHLHLNLAFFFVAIIVLLVASVMNTAVRIHRSEQILESKKKVV